VSAFKVPNWKMVVDDEYNALTKNKMWDLVSWPHDVDVIRSMWIFRHNEKFDGSFERHKVRLVVDDACQQVGIDYGELWLNQEQFRLSLVLLCLNLGKFINWMSRMPFYMASSKKQFTCINC
jgi:hypothetical protein